MGPGDDPRDGGAVGAFAARIGWSWTLPAYLALSAGLVALTVIDRRDQLLPDG